MHSTHSQQSAVSSKQSAVSSQQSCLFFQPFSVHSWTPAFLLAVHRLCGVIEGRLSHFLPRWLRMGWQSVISQGKSPWKTPLRLGLEPGPLKKQTVRFIHSPTELLWLWLLICFVVQVVEGDSVTIQCKSPSDHPHSHSYKTEYMNKRQGDRYLSDSQSVSTHTNTKQSVQSAPRYVYNKPLVHWPHVSAVSV